MKRILILLLVVYSMQGFARENTITAAGDPQWIAGGDEMFFMAPAFSPDRNNIAVTSARYTGLWVIDIETNAISQITDEDGAGFGYSWSDDSRALLARVSRYENQRRLTAVKIFDIDRNVEHTVVDYRRGISGVPQWNSTYNGVLIQTRERLELFDAPGYRQPDRIDNDRDRMIITNGASIATASVDARDIREIDPFPGEQYLNVAISPDGKKIAFEVLGGNMYAMNSDGSNSIDLGRGYRPQWSPDSEFIVYMITEDDGHNYTASDIYSIRFDGTDRTRLTDDPNRLYMNPSWSPGGGQIIFNDITDGAIYLLDIIK